MRVTQVPTIKKLYEIQEWRKSQGRLHCNCWGHAELVLQGHLCGKSHNLLMMNNFSRSLSLSVFFFDYVSAVRHLNPHLPQFYINKECNYANCQCESFMGTGSRWQQETHSDREEDPLKGLPYAVSVSLNKSVKPPPNLADCSGKGLPNSMLTDQSCTRD